MRIAPFWRRSRVSALVLVAFIAGTLLSTYGPFSWSRASSSASPAGKNTRPEYPIRRPVAADGKSEQHQQQQQQQQQPPPSRRAPGAIPCDEFPGADDVFVALKTGASEARSRLPVHFDTTFTCTPHYAIFSDLAETIDGYELHDALSYLPASTFALDLDEFHLYRAMAEHQRSGRTDYERFLVDFRRGGKEENPAWKLDKWKFLPILERSAAMAPPGTKWFVFMEADTYIVWPNLYAWLMRFDPARMWYLGGQWFMEDSRFAHGGTGFVLSAPALSALLASIRVEGERARIDAMLKEECCGDLILGVVMSKVGVDLTETWPMLQSERPNELDFSRDDFCFPVVSQHHMGPLDIREMWELTADWLKQVVKDWRSEEEQWRRWPLLHRNVYEWYVDGALSEHRVGWDNLSWKDKEMTADTIREKAEEMADRAREARERSHGAVEGSLQEEEEEEEHDEDERKWADVHETDKWSFTSAELCRRACEALDECLQWVYQPGTCGVSRAVRLGDRIKDAAAAPHWRSGWMLDRIAKFKSDMDGCEIRWITQNR